MSNQTMSPKKSRKLALLLCLATALIMIPSLSSLAETGAAAEPDPAKVERGGYLVTIMVCNDCHTPFHLTENGPEPDMSRMLSGHPQGMELPPAPVLPEGPWVMTAAATNTAWSGPWGVSFTANLTPDPETGLGQWTEQEFVRALRTGRHRGMGRQILPPMPWPFIGQASDEDLSAIFAFLQQIEPIRNQVPDPIPPAGGH